MVSVITGYGINADKELALAFEEQGAQTTFIHLSDWIENPALLSSSKIIAFPGGFSFGDHIGSGTILAHIVRNHLREAILGHLNAGGLIIGVCNGFQTLAKIGLLPNTKGDWENEVSLIHNSQGCFIDKWVPLKSNSKNRSVWLDGVEDFDCPIRHGEGQFICVPELASDFPDELVAFRYAENPNGSFQNIAGITDKSGQVLGMMPHPEAFTRPEQHPSRNALPKGNKIFQNGVKYAKSL